MMFQLIQHQIYSAIDNASNVNHDNIPPLLLLLVHLMSRASKEA